jgi:hypothetical protein
MDHAEDAETNGEDAEKRGVFLRVFASFLRVLRATFVPPVQMDMRNRV